MTRVAFFPGSFDPITQGHVDIILRGKDLFDKVIVGLGRNTSKNSLFTIDQRLDLLQATFGNIEGVEVVSFEGLTVNYCKANNIPFILRGLRNASDLDYERAIAESNRSIYPEIETIYLVSRPEFAHIQSTIVRELIKNNSSVSQFLPHGIQLPL
jgi:pantetheine-phosphate adenylyltransferase